MAGQTEDLVALLKQQILSYQAPIRTVDVGTVLQVGDGIARLSGLTNASAAELVEFENGVLGIVLNLEEDNVGARGSWPPWLQGLWEERESHLDPLDPDRTRRRLLRAEEMARASDDRSSHRERLRAALTASLPLLVEAVADTDVVVPGQEFELEVRIHNRSDAAVDVSSCRLTGLALCEPESVEAQLLSMAGSLEAGKARSIRLRLRVDPATEDWTAIRLVRDADRDRYRSPEEALTPERDRSGAGERLPVTEAAHLDVVLMVGGLPLELPPVPVVHRVLDARRIVAREVDLALLPPVEARFVSDPIMVPLEPGEEGVRGPVEVEVELTVRDVREVRLRPRVLFSEPPYWQDMADRPAGPWRRFVGPTRRRIRLAVDPGGPWEEISLLQVDVGGDVYDGLFHHTAIDYPHLRRAWLEECSLARVVPLRATLPRTTRIGYVRGSGDRVGDALAQVGLDVRFLDAEDLLEGDLDRFDVIVTGVRAYKVRPDLREAWPRLLEWMRAGGRMVVQYNKTGEMNGGARGEGPSPFLPYPGRVGTGRVTVEESPVKLLEPDHPLLTTPNRLEPGDFDGWVQERGLYFLDPADSRYRDLLELADPFPFNAGAKRGALVTAPVGRGSWTYVGLALFRQIPAGVPGAWRLLLNLIADR